MKYYWISDNSSVNQRLSMEKRCSNIPNERIAISGDILSKCNIIKHPLSSNASNKEYYKTLSHLLAIQKGYSDGEECFIVMEDNICISKLNTNKLMIYMNNFELDNNCKIDVLQIYTSNHTHISKLYHTHFAPNGRFIIKRDADYSGGGCYLVTRNGAKKILDQIIKYQDHYDFSDSKSGTVDDIIFNKFETCVLTYPMLLTDGCSNGSDGSVMHQTITNNVIKRIHERDDRIYLLT